MAPPDPARAAAESDQPPALASWKVLYVAALVNAALVMALIAAFSGWAF